MFGDDAAGVFVARRLKPFETDNLLVVEACYVPENFTGTVRRLQPDLVLLVDAAQMGARPGFVNWIDWRDTTGISASSHTGPLSSVANFIETTMGCEVRIVGIQPADLTMNAPLSPAVEAAVGEVVEALSGVARQECDTDHPTANGVP